MSSPISAFCIPLRLVLVVALLITGDEHGSKAQEVALGHLPVSESAALKSSKSKYWIEQRRLSTDSGVIEGPFVLRAAGKPTFIWQISSFPDFGLKSHTPFLMVLANKDSYTTLTNFISVPQAWPARISCVGFVEATGFSSRFCHTYEGDESGKVKESFEMLTADGEKVFELEKGRVFLIRHTIEGQACEVLQLAAELPPESTLRSAMTMRRNLGHCHKLLETWLLTLGNAKGTQLKSSEQAKESQLKSNARAETEAMPIKRERD